MSHRPLTSWLAVLATVSIIAACGGSSSPSGPAPIPTPAPTPTPTPAPTPTPVACTGNCEVTNNHNPVVRTGLRLYFLFDKERNIVSPTPDPYKGNFKETFPVGYMLRLDVTGRDEEGLQTFGAQGKIEWFFSDESLVGIVPRVGDFQRDVHVEKPGELTVYVIFDGVGSNDLNFRLVE
jgi:hypothetical protein